MYDAHGLLERERGLESTAQNNTRPASNPTFVNRRANLDLTEGMLEFNHMKKPRGWLDTLASVTAHSLVVAALILVPLLYTQAIALPKYQTTFLMAPAPPPPPPPPAAAIVQPIRHHELFQAGKLYSPKVIPKHIAVLKERAEPQQIAQGVPGGVIGGVPGGQLGGVLGGILSGRNTVVAPPPKPAAPRGPIRIGGDVQAPRLIRKVEPLYPPLAMEARIQGNVVIDCVIDPQGNVTEMKVVSGHPLLIQAAMQAVSEWKYQPTLLNGQPVSVEMLVTVRFNLQ